MSAESGSAGMRTVRRRSVKVTSCREGVSPRRAGSEVGRGARQRLVLTVAVLLAAVALARASPKYIEITHGSCEEGLRIENFADCKAAANVLHPGTFQNTPEVEGTCLESKEYASCVKFAAARTTLPKECKKCDYTSTCCHEVQRALCWGNERWRQCNQKLKNEIFPGFWSDSEIVKSMLAYHASLSYPPGCIRKGEKTFLSANYPGNNVDCSADTPCLCRARECVCSGGVAKVGDDCAEHGKESCASCDDGSQPLDNGGCFRKCTKDPYAGPGEAHRGDFIGGNKKCRKCLAGRYQSEVHHTNRCTRCVHGKFMYVNEVGATDESACKPCVEGKYGENEDGVQSKLGEGCKYSCPSGKWSNKKGLYKVSENNYINSITQTTTDTACYECPKGYWSGEAASSCTACEAGMWSDVQKSTTIFNCRPCGPGKWSSKSSLASDIQCTPCSPGKWSNGSGLESESQCKSCSPGKWSNKTAADSSNTCEECSLGKWSNATGSDKACIACPPDSYGSQLGRTSKKSCLQCPTGYSRSRQTPPSSCLKNDESCGKVDSRLQRIHIVGKSQNKARSMEFLPLTVRGGDDLVMHGWNVSAGTCGFLEGTVLQICGRNGACFNTSGDSVDPDAKYINISLPSAADVWHGQLGTPQEARERQQQGNKDQCLVDSYYLTIRISVPFSPLAPDLAAKNLTFECINGRDEARVRSTSSSTKCESTCGVEDSSGCPEFKHGGALYLLRDTCAEFEPEDYRVCLNEETAATCGYHVRTLSQSCGDKIRCKPCPLTALCPGGARIWPRRGYWVATELPPLQGSGKSPDPEKCPAPALKRCLGWNGTTGMTQCGRGYASDTYLCADCDDGYYSTFWNRSCLPCFDSGEESNGGLAEHLQADVDEAIIVLLGFLAVMIFLAGGVVLMVLLVGGSWRQGMYRGRRLIVFSIASMQILAQISQQATGYEDIIVLKLYSYLSLFTTLDTDGALPQECWSDDSHSPFVASNIIMAALITAFGVWFWLCFAPVGLCGRFCLWESETSPRLCKLQQALLVGLTLLYPLGARTALMSIRCVQVPLQGTGQQGLSSSLGSDARSSTISVLQMHPTVECFGSAHAANGVLGYATLLLVCVVFPGCLIWLVRCSKRFDQSTVTRNPGRHWTVCRMPKIGTQAAGMSGEDKKRNRGGAEHTAQEVEMNQSQAPSVQSIFNPSFQDPRASEVNLSAMNEQLAETEAETTDADASTDKSRRHSSRVSIRPTPVQAYARHKPGNLVAFKPLIDSDYKLAYLSFRPAYLYVLFTISVGTVIFPPSSPYAQSRLFFTMAVIVVYYGAFLWFRPLRRSRQWVLPVQLSIFSAGVLALALSMITEGSHLESENDAGVVRVLSIVIVVCVCLIIGVVIPAASIYDFIGGGKQEVVREQRALDVRRQSSFREIELSNKMQSRVNNYKAGGELSAEITNEVFGIETRFDEVSGAYYTYDLRTGTSQWVSEAPGGAAHGAATAPQEEMYCDEDTGAYYMYDSSSGSTRWVMGDVGGTAEMIEEEKHLDETTGAYYMYNTRTGSSTWLEDTSSGTDVALDEEGHLDDSPEAQYAHETGSGSSNSNEESDSSASEMLRGARSFDVPSGFSENECRGDWAVMVNENDGSTIYYNRRTREMRDIRPKGWVRMLAESVNARD